MSSLAHRESSVLISDATRTVAGVSYTVTAYSVGAMASANSSGATATVYRGHGFAVGDKLYNVNTGVFVGGNAVTSVTATTITMNGAAVSISAGDTLVNLGLDTGTASPNYDGSPILIYANPGGVGSGISSARVTANAAGSYEYWHSGDVGFWEIIRDPGGAIVKVVEDADGDPGEHRIERGVRYADLYATGGDGSSTSPWTGWESVFAENTPVHFRSGYYSTTTSPSIPAGSTVTGDGLTSKIIFTQSGDDGFVNATNAGDIIISDLYVDHDGNTAASTNACFQFTAGTGQNYLFRNVYIFDAAHTGIRIVGTAGTPTNVKIVNCTVDGAQRHGIEFSSDVTYGVIEGCYCESTNSATVGASIYAGSDTDAANIAVIGCTVNDSGDNGIRSAASDVTIAGNSVISPATDGIRLAGTRQTCTGNVVRSATGQGIKAEDYASISIAGNTCTGSTEHGIQVRYSNSQPSLISITGNVCSGCTLDGINILGGQDIVITGNLVASNVRHGVRVEAPASQTTTRVHVGANNFYANGTASADVSVGVSGGGTLGTCTIEGNTCDGGTTGKYGISVTSAGTSVDVLNNVVRNHATSEYDLTSGVFRQEPQKWFTGTTFSWNPGDLVDGAGETSTNVTATGAALGDYVLVSAPYDLQGITCTAYVQAANIVHIRLQNETGGSINLAAGNWTVRVLKA